MKIRTLSVFVALVSMTQIVSCQEIKEKNYHLAVEVKNPDGEPVADVRVIAGKLIPAKEGGGTLADAVTVESNASTAEGKILLEYKSLPEPAATLSVFGSGFYSSYYSFAWTSPEGYEGATRSAEVHAVLKPVRNPIPMSAKSFGSSRIMLPAMGVDFGYDMELCEFVPPHGKGKHEDVVFKVTGSNDGRGKGQIQMTVRGNGDQTGFVAFVTEDRDSGSALISDYLAPDNGYTNGISFAFNSDNMTAAMNQPKGGNYYFRVRCQLNPDGTIKSCFYGKLYGPITFWNIPLEQGGVASFGPQTIYFNPTPNDRNVEFDTKRNLLPGSDVPRP